MNDRSLPRWAVLFLALALALTGCGGDAGDGLPIESERPNASNTGVPAGTSLRSWTGGSALADSGVILEGYSFPALPGGSYYRLTGSNVTLRNCRLASGLLIQLAKNVRVERCEILGGVSVSGAVDVVLNRNNVHGSGDDLVHVTSDTARTRNVTFSSNFLHDAMPRCGAHADGIQVRGVDTLSLVNNAIDMGQWRQVCGLDALNSAVFLEEANGGNTRVVLDGNFLNGGGYTLRVGRSALVRIVRNRFGRDEGYGLALVTAQPGAIVEAVGNVRDDTGESVPIQ